MKSIEHWLTAEVAEHLREAIEENAGNELFAVLSRSTPKALFDSVSVVARGTENAVPALFSRIHWGEVAVHNHPSGVLLPSPNDLNIAHLMGEEGAGSLIINNEVTQGHMIIEPADHPETMQVSNDKVTEVFGKNGPLAGALPNYQERPSQREMAKSVMDALNGQHHLVAEAGTGTGKSLAYLVPALLWSKATKKRVVIATKTIALQEQLVYKDIPIARTLIADAPEAAMVKGRNNYVCLRKLNDVTTIQMSLWEDEEKSMEQEVEDIAHWVEETQGGDKSQLPFIPSYAAWEKVQSESDMCLGNKCPHFQKSPFFQSRRDSARAGILIVNQALLFSDLAVRASTGNYKAAAVLPSYDAVILDEAHSIEEIATKHFGSQITSLGLKFALSKLLTLKNNSGLLVRFYQYFIQRNLTVARAYFEEEIQIEFIEARDEVMAKLEELNQQLHLDLNPENDREQVFWLHESMMESPAVDRARTLAKSLFSKLMRLNKIVKKVQNFIKDIQDEKEENDLQGMKIELDARFQRLDQVLSALKSFAIKTGENQIPWLQLKRVRNRPEFAYHVSPLNVSESLIKGLFEPLKTVIMTSATLDLKDEFHFFKSRIGLDRLAEGRLQAKHFATPFDLRKQAVVSVPLGPDWHIHQKPMVDLAETILRTHHRLAGGTLVLFTSYSMLHGVARHLELPLSQDAIPLLIQGSQQRSVLIDRLKTTHGILLGTDTFWEGIDLPGLALTKVIMAKLPFPQIKEPIFEARSQALEQEGKSSFKELSLPMALLKFKQGAGRLIRSREDRGVIVVADTRIKQKFYGRNFMAQIKEIPEVPMMEWPSYDHV